MVAHPTARPACVKHVCGQVGPVAVGGAALSGIVVVIALVVGIGSVSSDVMVKETAEMGCEENKTNFSASSSNRNGYSRPLLGWGLPES